MSLVRTSRNKKRKNYLFTIAIDKYEDTTWPKLGNCVRDAKAVANVLQQRYGFEEILPPLFDEKATEDNIMDALETIAKHPNIKKNNLLIYYAGHGEYKENKGQGFLIPYNANHKRIKSLITNAEFKRELLTIPSFHAAVIMDSCFAGALLNLRGKYTDNVENKESRWLFAAGGMEFVSDGYVGRNSPFAESIIEFLEENQEERISFSKFAQTVQEATPEKGTAQTPIFGIFDTEAKKGVSNGQMIFTLQKSEADAWQDTIKQNTITAYNNFIASYPNSEDIEEAEQHRNELAFIDDLKLDIERENRLMDRGNFPRAKKNFDKLLKELIEEVQTPERKKEYEKILLEKIKICTYAPKCKPFLDKASQTQIKSLKSQIENLKNQLSQTNPEDAETIKDLNQQLAAAITTNEILQQEISTRNQQITQLKKTIATQEQTLLQHQQEIENTKNQYVLSLQVKDKKIKEITTKIDSLVSEKNRLEERIEELESPNKIKSKDFIDDIDGVALDMIYVEGGSFMMGSDKWKYSQPIHKVTVPSFHIGKYPVTQALWKKVMGNNPSHFKGDNLPVETVSWKQCQEFINKLNDMIGKKYRLPSDAEWEFAARGGMKSVGYAYAGSDDIDEVGWYRGNLY